MGFQSHILLVRLNKQHFMEAQFSHHKKQDIIILFLIFPKLTLSLYKECRNSTT